MEIKQHTYHYANGNMAYRCWYYHKGKRDIYHGIYELYHEDGNMSMKLFIKHDIDIGFGLVNIADSKW